MTRSTSRATSKASSSSPRASSRSRPRKCRRSAALSRTCCANVARTFARAESAIIFWGMGVSQHTHGTDNARCLIALSLICGQIGRPAPAASAARPEQRAGRLRRRSDPDVLPRLQIGGERRNPRQIRGRLGVKLDPKRGKTVVEIMDAVHDDEIKGMYIMGENPAMSDPDLNTRAARWRISSILWCRTSS